MVENRDRVSNLIIDDDVHKVLEFMQSKIVTTKLVAVADSLPGLARLLWGGDPQEPCQMLSLVVPKTAEPSQ